jgi:hypothetical protein
MSSTGRPEQTIDVGVLADAKSACVALVPLVQPAPWSRPAGQLPRPDPIFITHLIATAEQVPQTRSLRRATDADAQTAYSARRVQGAGMRTRQII